MSEQLNTLTSRFDQTSDDVRQRAARAAAEIAAEQARLRRADGTTAGSDARECRGHAPGVARPAPRHRAALEPHLAPSSTATSRTRSTHPPHVRRPCPRRSPEITNRSLHRGDARSRTPQRGLSSLGEAAAATRPGRRRPSRNPVPACAPRARPAQGGDPRGRRGWSLGDLLARASREEEGHGAAARSPQQRPQASSAFHNQIDVIARALDPATTSAIWSRLNAGQRGIMVRSIYHARGPRRLRRAQRCAIAPIPS